jgi:dienelactone hydrolase
MSEYYQHLGAFSDWVTAAHRQQPLYPIAAPGPETQARLREVLGFCRGPEKPADVLVERRWEKDGLAGEEISWSVGYGPRTHAYVFKPSNASGPLRGVVALHDHSAFKYWGKEKIAEGPGPDPAVLTAFRRGCYGGRAYVNALAREGFVVLAHDVFLWGSRGFSLETMEQMVGEVTEAVLAAIPRDPVLPPEIDRYNTAAALHEHWVAKYCNVLGTSLAGVVAYEDRVAANYLLSRPDVAPEHVGCLGLSGGGNRAALLLATHDQIRAAVIVGLMTTYPGLLDHNMSHTWMLFPYGWARYGDWPDIAACRAPSPLLVQYDLDDDLFTESGMRDAHTRLQQHYAGVGRPEAYEGQFCPGPHRFDQAMQVAAFAWLKRHLAEGARRLTGPLP